MQWTACIYHPRSKRVYTDIDEWCAQNSPTVILCYYITLNYCYITRSQNFGILLFRIKSRGHNSTWKLLHFNNRKFNISVHSDTAIEVTTAIYLLQYTYLGTVVIVLHRSSTRGKSKPITTTFGTIFLAQSLAAWRLIYYYYLRRLFSYIL